MRGWNVASSLSLGDLQRLIEAKESEVAGLNARRESLAAELADVEADLADAGGGKKRGRKPGRTKGKRGPGRPKGKRRPGRPKGSRNKPKARAAGKRGPGRPKGLKNKPKAKVGGKRGPKAGPKGQSDLHNAIRASFNRSGPMKAADIAKKVVAGGYKTKSKVFHLIVGQRLSEMRDVKKAGRGMYAMR